MIRLVLILCFAIASCMVDGNKEMDIRDIRIFNNTAAWGLAQAVKNGDIHEISGIAKECPDILNYQESRYGFTVLMWGVKMEKYDGVKALLELGANPDVRSNNGKTALFLATEYSWLDNEAKKDPKYVDLLLLHNADPNIGTAKPGIGSTTAEGTTPLMIASTRSFAKAESLVKGGADINSKTASKETAASMALLDGLGESVDVAYYLIVKKGAIVNEPYYFFNILSDGINFDNPHYPIESLEDWLFELGSDQHKKKIAIVEEFKKQGQDYWTMKKHPKTIERIKKLYPNNWQEYLKKY